MLIGIPSVKRAHNQQTLKSLNIVTKHPIIVFTSTEDYNEYRAKTPCQFGVMAVSGRIAETRDYIVKYAIEKGHKKLVMMDDDLLFYCRKTKSIDDWHLRYLEGEEINTLLDELESNLDQYAHVGISAREGNNRAKSLTEESTRMMRVLGYDLSILKGEDLSFRIPGVDPNGMEDFWMTLQLLTLGYPNLVSFFWAQGQFEGSHAPGGSSSWSSLETQKNSAIALNKTFPDFVKLVEKTTETAWGATKNQPVTRTDVMIQWKKSLGSRIHLSKIPSTPEPTDTNAPGAL